MQLFIILFIYLIYFFLGGWGGVQILISIETYITCDFSGGGGGCPDHLSPSGSAHRLEISNCPLPRLGLSFVGAN